MLDAAGYSFDFHRAVYVNKGLRKVFSRQFIEDHSAEEIGACLSEAAPGAHWRFYFNTTPSSAVREQLEAALA